MLLGLVRSRTSIEAENVALRHQLSVLCRSATKRPVLRMSDRLVFILLYRLAPSILDAVTIVRPETIVRWHRAGFRIFWHALEVSTTTRQAQGASRSSAADPRDEPSKARTGHAGTCSMRPEADDCTRRTVDRGPAAIAGEL